MSKDRPYFEPCEQKADYPHLTSGPNIVTVVELAIFAKKHSHISRLIKTLKKLEERNAKRGKDYIITFDNVGLTYKLYTTTKFISRYEDNVF